MPGMSVAIVQEKRLRAVQRRKKEVEEKEMKSVLISIQPKWCELIASGKKTIEVRKSRPKLETPFKCYIYQTKSKQVEHCDGCDITYYGCGKVIGEFVCDKIVKYDYQVIACAKYEVNGGYVKEELRYNAGACLTAEEMFSYSKGKPLYGWHISDLKIYDKPKPIMQFYKPCPIKLGFKNCPGCEFYSTDTGCCMNNVTRPPQSWYYVEE